MKKLLIVTFLLFLGGHFFSTAFGQSHDIPLSIIDEDGISEGNTKAPPFVITQEGYILTLPATSEDYTLQLRDESGTVVYSSYIPAGTTQIILPTTLFGSFEIRLVAVSYYYVGYIIL